MIFTPLRVNPHDYDDMSISESVFLGVLHVAVFMIIWICIYGAFYVPLGAEWAFWPCVWEGIKFYGVFGLIILFLVKV